MLLVALVLEEWFIVIHDPAASLFFECVHYYLSFLRLCSGIVKHIGQERWHFRFVFEELPRDLLIALAPWRMCFT